jgi:hypothetical protein
MLAGVGERLHHVLPPLQGIQDGSDLHEIGTSSNDVKYIHKFSNKTTNHPNLFEKRRAPMCANQFHNLLNQGPSHLQPSMPMSTLA